MSVAQPNLPGSGTTLRILRDDGVTFVGITVPSEMLWPGPVGARLAQSPGLSTAEQARARNIALTQTRQPREPSMEGPGWAIYTFPGTQQLYVLRDDGTHLSWGGGPGLFTPARAAGVISATPGLSATEIARLSSILGGAVASGGTPTPSAAPLPQNYDMIAFSDSRSDAHGVTATQDGTGYKPTMYNRGVAGLIGALSAHKIRLGRTPNCSISGGSVQDATFDPRRPQGGGTATAGTWYRGSVPTSGSDNKGFVQAGQAVEGLVFILLGTNGFVAGTGAGSSFAGIQSIIAGILAQNANKVIVLANELPKGIDNANVTTANDLGTGGAAFKTYSDNLMKLSFDSGDALANPRVISVDTFSTIRDTSDPTVVARNLRGTLTDGLHPSAYGAKLITQAVVTRLSSVWANWAGLPAQISIPTANGFANIADAQPFLNSNPIMTAGTNGTVLSTWGTAPTAATVPQGWQISGTNVGSISVVCDKTTVPGEWKITISGTLTVANSAPIILQNNVAAGTISNGALFSLTDKLRPMVAVAIDAGSVGLISVSARGTIFGDTGAKNRVGISGAASGLGKINDFSDYGDGVVRRFMGEVLDLAEPNMQITPGALTSVSSITPAVYIEFAGAIGDPVSAVIRVREAGIYRSAS